MAFQPVPGTAEVVVTYTYQGAEWVNTFYAFMDGTWSDVDLQALADATDTAVTAGIKTILSNTISYTGVQARGLRDEFDIFVSANAGAGVGGIASAITSAQAAYCLTRFSAFTGRSARGRVYLPAPTVAQMDSTDKNLVTTSYRNAALASLNAVTNGQAAIDWTPVIVSRVQGGVVLAEAQTFIQTGWRARDLRIDTQRRRLAGSG